MNGIVSKKVSATNNTVATHLTVPGEVDLQRLPVVLKPERSHGEQDVFAVYGFALLLLAFFRSWWHKLATAFACNICHLPWACWYVPSLVMNEINSDTHSCMHSFASFAILAFSGKADFMILATGAKFCMLASGWMYAALEALFDALEDERCCGGDEDSFGDGEGIAICATHHPVARVGGCRWLASKEASDSTQYQKRATQWLYVGGEDGRLLRPQHLATAAGLCMVQVSKGKGSTSFPVEREGRGGKSQ